MMMVVVVVIHFIIIKGYGVDMPGVTLENSNMFTRDETGSIGED